MLFSPPELHAKVQKLMDIFLKKYVVKFACRYKKIAKLAQDINIRIVLENECNLKKLLVNTKIAYKRLFIFLGGLGNHS